ncbi:hypothetical protein [Glycomyces harbinensis]|uniref:hypothetical protein n=1 Tax=Glycomyces harbinensis TaxID=58114 RepID=UPI00115FFA7D|nr:hypothetical protein [Glycomyces harbinensis]
MVLLTVAVLIVAVAVGLGGSGLVSGFHLMLMIVVALLVALGGRLTRGRVPASGWPAAMDRPRPGRKASITLLPFRDGLDGVSSAFAASRLARCFEAAADEGEAEAALAELLGPGPRVWLEFDPAIRNWTRFRRHGTDLARVGAPIPETPLGFALALASGDGFRRAEVLQHPGVSEHPVLYPLVLLRAVDHVPQIRALATALLPRLIAASDHETFAAMLTVACRLQHRAHAAPTLDLILAALGESADDDLLAILARSDGRSARWAGQALMSERRLPVRQLSAIATGRFDDQLQERCAETLAEQALSQRNPEPLRPLLPARSARVRTSALTGLIRLDQFEGIGDFLTDRSAAVRATAQWGLRRAGQDPAARYRELLHLPLLSPKPVIQGLGECGQRADAGLVVPFVEDPRSQTRAAAVSALRRLGAELDLLWLLFDPAPSVTRVVAVYLAESQALPPVETLRELVQGSQPRHVRRAAATLLREHGIWHRIWVGLALYDDPDTKLSLEGLSGLDYMCRYQVASITAPIDDQLRGELQAFVRSRSNRLHLDTRQTLRWLIDTARPTAAS